MDTTEIVRHPRPANILFMFEDADRMIRGEEPLLWDLDELKLHESKMFVLKTIMALRARLLDRFISARNSDPDLLEDAREKYHIARQLQREAHESYEVCRHLISKVGTAWLKEIRGI